MRIVTLTPLPCVREARKHTKSVSSTYAAPLVTFASFTFSCHALLHVQFQSILVTTRIRLPNVKQKSRRSLVFTMHTEAESARFIFIQIPCFGLWCHAMQLPTLHPPFANAGRARAIFCPKEWTCACASSRQEGTYIRGIVHRWCAKRQTKQARNMCAASLGVCVCSPVTFSVPVAGSGKVHTRPRLAVGSRHFVCLGPAALHGDRHYSSGMALLGLSRTTGPPFEATCRLRAGSPAI